MDQLNYGRWKFMRKSYVSVYRVGTRTRLDQNIDSIAPNG